MPVSSSSSERGRALSRTHVVCAAALIGFAAIASGQDDPPAAPPPPDTIELIGGDVIHGFITESTDEQITLRHEDMGLMTIPRSQIAAINPPTKAELEAAKKRQWRSRFKLAATGTYGNTDNQSLNVGVSTERETEEEKTLFRLDYYYGAEDGDKNESRLSALARNDWLIPDSKWFYFIDGTYDYDEFQSWDHRLAGHLGVGYEWIEEDDLDVNLRAGLGASKEWGSDDDDIKPEGLLGIDLSWKVNETQDLTASMTYFPDLAEFSEFRTVTRVDWTMLLDSERNMSLTAGLLHEYESEVDPGFEHYDLKIFFGLTFDF